MNPEQAYLEMMNTPEVQAMMKEIDEGFFLGQKIGSKIATTGDESEATVSTRPSQTSNASSIVSNSTKDLDRESSVSKAI